MRKVDKLLWHIVDAVTKCIVLHNLCRIRKEKFVIGYNEHAKRKCNRQIENILLIEGQKVIVKSTASSEAKINKNQYYKK